MELTVDPHVNILMVECARKKCVAETLRNKIGSTIGIAGVIKMGNDDQDTGHIITREHFPLQ